MNKTALLLILSFTAVMAIANATGCTMINTRNCYRNNYKGINICAYATDGYTCCDRRYSADFSGYCVSPLYVSPLGTCDETPLPEPAECPRNGQQCPPYGFANCTQATDGATFCQQYPGTGPWPGMPPNAICIAPPPVPAAPTSTPVQTPMV